jgi:predicted ferric reductase
MRLSGEINMSEPTQLTNNSEETFPEGTAGKNVLVVILVALAGVLLTINLMPFWLPGMEFSIQGTEPKLFWFLSRGSAIVAYWILWLSMAMGIAITNKMAKVWPGISPAYEVHQFTSLMGLGFALFHAFILMGDQYIHYSFLQVLVPFASQSYRPEWIGLGQLGFYIWALVAGSFYVRKRIGQKTWRLFHFVSYASFLSVMVHGIYSGTDTSAAWVQFCYWASGASLLFLTIYRVLVSRFPVETGKPRPEVHRPA